MKVLWISNIVFPEAEKQLTGGKLRSGSGGWLSSLAYAIKEDVSLVIAAPSHMVDKLTKVEVDNITHYVFPIGKGNYKYNHDYEPIWLEIKDAENPDLVHIHGTEFSHGLAYLKACGSENVVVSIQGVMTEIAKHYLGGLSNKDIFCNLTLHDIFRTSLWGEKKKAEQRAKSEPEILKMTKYVIGRTDFDHAHALAMNPDVRYFHCDEVLREEFYTGQWEYENCTPHTIFVSGSRYPLKGFHMLLRALPIIIRQYPDVIVSVAGSRGLEKEFRKKWSASLTGYQKIIITIIKKLHLEKHVVFLGVLTAEKMKEELLKANVFLSTSSNENSSNAIGEAQLLGVPCLASFVGGTPDMIPDAMCGSLYNYFDINILAYKICHIFESSKQFNNSLMRAEASRRHNRFVNAERTLEIYKLVLNESK